MGRADPTRANLRQHVASRSNQWHKTNAANLDRHGLRRVPNHDRTRIRVRDSCSPGRQTPRNSRQLCRSLVHGPKGPFDLPLA